MKKLILFTLCGVAGLVLLNAADTGPAPSPGSPAPESVPPATNSPAADPATPAQPPGAPETPPTNDVPAAAGAIAPPPAPAEKEPEGPPPFALASSNGTNGIVLNLREAPLEMVLSNLSAVAGFIIVPEVQPRGKINLVSYQPLSKEEVVDLINSELNRNGYTAIRKGRKLIIVNRDEAKTKALPVRSGNNPDGIPETDEMVTQIIPVRYVEAGQIIKDLQPLVSPQVAMTANESGNAIVITDTQANIRRVAEVIQAIDAGAEDLTVVKVFRLTHASPQETADLLTSLFPDDNRGGGGGGGTQSPMAFGGFRRFFGGGGGGPGGGNQGGGSNAQNQRIRKRNRVVAVPDQRTSSVVVTASKDLMDQIEQVVDELDQNPANMNSVAVFPLQNASPEDAMQVLQDLFNKNTALNQRQNQNQNRNVLQNRSTTQGQQNNTGTRNGLGRGGVGGGGGGFGQ